MATLMDRVYEDLVRVADRHLKARHGPDLAGTTLEPAALANETFLKLIKQRNRYDSRGHFFAIATKVMLRVLNDYYRARHAAKRGGGLQRVTLTGLDDEKAKAAGSEIPEFLDALEQLEKLGSRPRPACRSRRSSASGSLHGAGWAQSSADSESSCRPARRRSRASLRRRAAHRPAPIAHRRDSDGSSGCVEPRGRSRAPSARRCADRPQILGSHSSPKNLTNRGPYKRRHCVAAWWRRRESNPRVWSHSGAVSD